jgi:hypothetical protein
MSIELKEVYIEVGRGEDEGSQKLNQGGPDGKRTPTSSDSGQGKSYSKVGDIEAGNNKPVKVGEARI